MWLNIVAMFLLANIANNRPSIVSLQMFDNKNFSYISVYKNIRVICQLLPSSSWLPVAHLKRSTSATEDQLSPKLLLHTPMQRTRFDFEFSGQHYNNKTVAKLLIVNLWRLNFDPVVAMYFWHTRVLLCCIGSQTQKCYCVVGSQTQKSNSRIVLQYNI